MVSRAVFFWQLFGNILKSGWTSLLPFCSEYNTFVSTNSGHFKSATFTKESYRNIDSIGATATKGKLGTLTVTPTEILTETQLFVFNSVQFNSIAKVGDKIKLLIGQQDQETMSYSEVVVTSSLLNTPDAFVQFNASLERFTGVIVYALWLETADGKDSTTSKFTTYAL